MTKDILFDLFITKNLSQRAVGRELNCSQATVRHFLKKYKITKNKKNDLSTDQSRSSRCSKCKEIKSIGEFYLRKRSNGNITSSSWCRSCNSKGVIKTQQNTKSKLVKLKGGSCQTCNFNEYDGALEFHHVDSTLKDDKLSKLIRSSLSKDIIDEINKCVLVCSNCHKMIHAGIRECPIPIVVGYEALK